VERSLANFFRRGNLIALREMALQRVTRAVDRNLDEYVRRKRLGAHWSVSEKVAVCISSSAQARDLIARGARLAEALSAELYVLHVSSPRDEEPERKRLLASSLQFAKNLGATIVPLTGSDTSRVTGTFIRENRITQAMVGRSATHGLRSYLYYFAIQKFMSEAPHVDLHIVTQEKH
jgi:two-component system sensor histidine kinase KdpD